MPNLSKLDNDIWNAIIAMYHSPENLAKKDILIMKDKRNLLKALEEEKRTEGRKRVNFEYRVVYVKDIKFTAPLDEEDETFYDLYNRDDLVHAFTPTGKWELEQASRY